MAKIAFSRPPKRCVRLAMTMVLALTSLASSGCIRKRMTIRTSPPGAMAYVDKQPIGLTPVSTSYTYYGTRSFEIIRDGHRTEKFLRKFDPPWYAIPPLDFFSETLWPFELRDERIIDLQMSPDPIVPREALIASGDQLRLQASQGVAVSPPPTVVNPGPNPPPMLNQVPFSGNPIGGGTFNSNPPVLGPATYP